MPNPNRLFDASLRRPLAAVGTAHLEARIRELEDKLQLAETAARFAWDETSAQARVAESATRLSHSYLRRIASQSARLVEWRYVAQLAGLTPARLDNLRIEARLMSGLGDTEQ